MGGGSNHLFRHGEAIAVASVFSPILCPVLSPILCPGTGTWSSSSSTTGGEEGEAERDIA